MKIRKVFAVLLSMALTLCVSLSAVAAASQTDMQNNGQSISVTGSGSFTKTDSLTDENNEKYYWFDAPGQGYFTITLKTNAQTNADGIKDGWDFIVYRQGDTDSILSEYDITSSATTCRFGTAAGRYYILVKASDSYYGCTEPFDLVVNYQLTNGWEAEFNDETAQVISTDENSNGSVYGNLYTSGDVDLYRFELKKRGYFQVRINATADADTDKIREGWKVTLSDGSRQTLDSFSTMSDYITSKYPYNPGQYYLKVESNGNSYDSPVGQEYQLSVIGNVNDSWEVEPNDTLAQATAISTGKTYNGITGYSSDADYYSFTTTGGRATINFARSASFEDSAVGDGWNMSLIKNGQTLEEKTNVTNAVSIIRDLAAGTYYLKMETDGSYKSPVGCEYSFNVNVAAKKTKKIAKVKISSAKNIKPKKIKVVWKKAKNAKQYQIAYRMTSAKKWTTKKVKKTSYVISKLKKKKKYQIRVRGVNGKKYGAWSAIKKVTVKK